MKKPVKQPRRAPVSDKKCHLLSAPAEIRLAIYGNIVRHSFLPWAPFRDYIGLFFSCKRISDEMKHESLRIAPSVLREIQERRQARALTLRPLRPVNFSSLMHVTVGIPRWTLFSSIMMEDTYNAFMPLLKLHLSTLTIGIEDIESDWDLTQCLIELGYDGVGAFMDAHHNAPAISGGAIEEVKFYQVLTTYADIILLATAINCMVAPQLCTDGKHDQANGWCIRNVGIFPPPGILAPPDTPCNVRKVILRLKKLHDEVMCPQCGEAPHDIYEYNSIRLRWCPTYEWKNLRHNGWDIMWANEQGVIKTISKENPAVFVWSRAAPTKKRGVPMQAVKNLGRPVQAVKKLGRAMQAMKEYLTGQ